MAKQRKAKAAPMKATTGKPGVGKAVPGKAAVDQRRGQVASQPLAKRAAASKSVANQAQRSKPASPKPRSASERKLIGQMHEPRLAHALLLGIDITEVSRVEQMLANHGQRFLARVFTAQELLDAGEGKGKCMHLAARFAAKEAAMKALGTGLASGITWHDVETIRTPTGAPQLLLHSRAAEIARSLGAHAWTLSLTHTKSVAVAVVIGL